jgi:hypothetical protein
MGAVSFISALASADGITPAYWFDSLSGVSGFIATMSVAIAGVVAMVFSGE